MRLCGCFLQALSPSFCFSNPSLQLFPFLTACFSLSLSLSLPSSLPLLLPLLRISIGHNEVIGMCRVGSEAEGPGREHWAAMLANPRKPIEHWHQLVEVMSIRACESMRVHLCAFTMSTYAWVLSITIIIYTIWWKWFSISIVTVTLAWKKWYSLSGRSSSDRIITQLLFKLFLSDGPRQYLLLEHRQAAEHDTFT